MTIPKMPQRINKIGIELEGFWHEKPSGAHEDGSVGARCDCSDRRSNSNFCCECGCDSCDDGDHCGDSDCMGGESGFQGELSSPQLSPVRFASFVNNYYPNHVDESCGMHVHMSFVNPSDYTRLMYPDFWDYFLESMETWATAHLNAKSRFWHRFNGQNTYCEKIFRPERQWMHRGREGARYAMLNFCWGLHGTLECRLLPMFDKKEVAVAAIKHLVSLVNTFLNTCDAGIISFAVPTEEEPAEVCHVEYVEVSGMDVPVSLNNTEVIKLDSLSVERSETIQVPLNIVRGHGAVAVAEPVTEVNIGDIVEVVPRNIFADYAATAANGSSVVFRVLGRTPNPTVDEQCRCRDCWVDNPAVVGRI